MLTKEIFIGKHHLNRKGVNGKEIKRLMISQMQK
jgi:hypothetical protein